MNDKQQTQNKIQTSGDLIITNENDQEQVSKEKVIADIDKKEWYIKMGTEISEMVEEFLDWDTNDLNYRESQFARQLIWKFQDYSIDIHRELRHKNMFPIKFVALCAIPFITNEDVFDIKISDQRVSILANSLLHILSSEENYGKYNGADGNVLYLRDVFNDIRFLSN